MLFEVAKKRLELEEKYKTSIQKKVSKYEVKETGEGLLRCK